MAKLSVESVPPPDPTVPPELEELVLEVLEVEELDELLALELPEHDSPQIEPASVTHVAFQLVVQQYESAAHTWVTQGSHPFTSLAPATHSEWAHVPPELLELELDELVPQLLGSGGAWQRLVSALHHQPP
jgi:hypothetical protein